ncbi:MAG: hypothetical protein O2905_05175, partial [Proteobacteria bacterium]|nr:hypothetical protein [Pseudomonadota bacterium]
DAPAAEEPEHGHDEAAAEEPAHTDAPATEEPEHGHDEAAAEEPALTDAPATEEPEHGHDDAPEEVVHVETEEDVHHEADAADDEVDHAVAGDIHAGDESADDIEPLATEEARNHEDNDAAGEVTVEHEDDAGDRALDPVVADLPVALREVLQELDDLAADERQVLADAFAPGTPGRRLLEENEEIGALPIELLQQVAADADNLPPALVHTLTEMPPDVFAALPAEVFVFSFLDGEHGPFVETGLEESEAAHEMAASIDEHLDDTLGAAEAAVAAAVTPQELIAAQQSLDRLYALADAGNKLHRVGDELAEAAAYAERAAALARELDVGFAEAADELEAARTALGAAQTRAESAAARARLAQAQSRAAEIGRAVTVARAETAIAATQLAVARADNSVARGRTELFRAERPVQMFAAEVALDNSERELEERLRALESLRTARAALR